MLRKLGGQPSGEQESGLPAGPHVSSLYSEPDEMGIGISQLEINPFLSFPRE